MTLSQVVSVNVSTLVILAGLAAHLVGSLIFIIRLSFQISGYVHKLNSIEAFYFNDLKKRLFELDGERADIIERLIKIESSLV